jgi:hypothetical protein
MSAELALDLTGGFKLAAADSFDLLSHRGFTGGFAGVSVDGQACSATQSDVGRCNVGFFFDLGFGPNGLEVSVAGIPEPSTWVMLAGGFLGLGGLRLFGRKGKRTGAEGVDCASGCPNNRRRCADERQPYGV